ncbi:MAG: 3-hydroxyacyl-CoA dehydrogenase / 3a,7a,12a-trihydroxy-5b-cholest-24-enoyl-CoA hydratase [Nevskia sp.]|nr:3-hydroxyacyl-CoA dehydrogenase / 3a,7a,12a-trihydroxy-5b-cholest-24-enoyl-CoA hydratase [Nevskia sp.]
MSEQLRFDGKVVIITGAGNGLGKSHALLFGARGAKVVVNDLGGGAHGDGKSSAAADKVVEEIKALGGEAVANYNSVEDGDKIVQTALDAFGTVDIVVNNAGILRDVSFQKMTLDDWNLIYRVHLNGAFRVTHAAWPIMRDKGYGRIIMTTSAAGIYGNFGQANYTAAKLGLVGLANTLAIEGRNKNVHVNTIAPIAASRLTETVLPPEILQHLKPEYVSPLVGWLCSEECKETGGLFEVGAGTVNKLRWERTRGHGFRVNTTISPEDYEAKWAKICDFTDAEHPETIAASMSSVLDNVNNPKRGGNQFIDLDLAMSQPPVEVETSYDERDLSLYALGVGAGANPLDSSELRLIHERGDKFYPLPTYGVMPALNGFMKLMQEGKQPPGMNVGFDRVLHGEQYTEIKRPLPPHAKLKHKSKMRDAYDKGKDAIGIIDVHSYDETGEEVAYNEITFFLRGAGGWGGDRGPSGDVNVPPQREPDAVIEEKIGDAQALLYRLSGDWNPLHVDPEFARNFGFDRPILHGLCTFGYVGRHVIKAFCDNDPRRFKSIKVRFAKSVYPGETLVTRMWKESDLRIVFETKVKERDEVVIKNAAVELYEQIPLAKPKAKAVAAAGAVAVQPAKLISADVFAAIGSYIAQNPGVVEQAKTLFQFQLSEPDSQWVVDMKNGKGDVRQGTVDKPDATLDASDENFLAMCTGAADAQKLFFAGKLKIAGNMMAAAKLEFLKKMDPKLAEDAMKARLAAGGGAAPAVAAVSVPAQPTGPVSADVFSAIGAYVAQNPKLVEQAKTLFQFKLSEPDSDWVVDLKNDTGSVRSGLVDKPDATLTATEENFIAMCTGAADAQKLFFAGKLKIAGNMMAASKLEFLKSMDPKLVEAATRARLASGGAAPATAPAAAATASKAGKASEIFAALTERLGKTKKAEAAGAVLQFNVSNPEAHWIVDFKSAPPKVEQGSANGGAAAVFGIADEDLVALAKGETKAQDLFQRGKLRVDGDVRFAQKLSFLDSLI